VEIDIAINSEIDSITKIYVIRGKLLSMRSYIFEIEAR